MHFIKIMKQEGERNVITIIFYQWLVKLFARLKRSEQVVKNIEINIEKRDNVVENNFVQ